MRGSCHLADGGSWVIATVNYQIAKYAVYWGGVGSEVLGSILHGGFIWSFGYFLLQIVVHNWSIKGCGGCCCVCGKVHLRDPLLLIRKSSLCGESGFPLKRYLTITIPLMSNSR